MMTKQAGNDVYIEDCGEFDIVHTFECGQCFRWNKGGDGAYTGVYNGKVLRISQSSNRVILHDTSIKDYENIWKAYFDLDRDYKEVQKILASDSVMRAAIEDGKGIRILRQNPEEMIISFIISANNNIPRIKLIIERLCALFGQKIDNPYGEYYSFPDIKTLSSLSLEDIAPIKAGFRDKYILDAAKKIAAGEIDIKKIYSMNYEDAKSELKKIKGVGEKVSNCILLFGFSKVNAFPVDVWIKRIIEHYYRDEYNNGDIAEFAKARYGDLGGFAQQYLFYHARENKIAK